MSVKKFIIILYVFYFSNLILHYIHLLDLIQYCVSLLLPNACTSYHDDSLDHQETPGAIAN